jgi:hypothetical protein
MAGARAYGGGSASIGAIDQETRCYDGGGGGTSGGKRGEAGGIGGLISDLLSARRVFSPTKS